ncbi:hypothetical protein IF1G_08803 [Cordyceps javanica]|uniref:Uncharacterized protein n=1 Tax=Cordyceps javanica TaxID=43265 RepID=A0A545US66_9HYPO|nr:hypothetical protein IF1G_08803 [Cordyceps javanica]
MGRWKRGGAESAAYSGKRLLPREARECGLVVVMLAFVGGVEWCRRRDRGRRRDGRRFGENGKRKFEREIKK